MCDYLILQTIWNILNVKTRNDNQLKKNMSTTYICVSIKHFLGGKIENFVNSKNKNIEI